MTTCVASKGIVWRKREDSRRMASMVSIRFYAELNDFLLPEKRQVSFSQGFNGRPAVKALIESLGVPHTEVDLILINQESVDFSCRVRDGNRISVYPVFEALDIRPILRVRPEPLREPSFILDTHLGRLAGYLRMAGFDTLYQNDYADEALASASAGEKRILLTRDRGLLKRSVVTHGYLVRSDNPQEQLKEVLHRFDLFNAMKPFRLCLRCNEPLRAIPATEAKGSVPRQVWEQARSYKSCPVCGRIYWKGSHYQKMAGLISRIREKAGRAVCVTDELQHDRTAKEGGSIDAEKETGPDRL